ncbi:Dynein light chain 2, cytoplasmic [Galemys pyrenaicus]|uniref:Dynein light chain 2, cytoplasmic n=1 Tax=Galemys pyrenaicus TaxID=202257 RepID=A0A8J6AFY8_GALPY|nr:Dynein light chain 2, cytoplasmic [Galemys pyrenaicus]
MRSADGSARDGGAGAGRYFRGPRVCRAQRRSRAKLRGANAEQAARQARGGARAVGEARRADGGGGGGERSARGCGSPRPRRRRLLLEEPRGHRPCPRPPQAIAAPPGPCLCEGERAWVCQPYLCFSCSITMSDRKAVIKNADMSEDMQQDAVDCATQAMEKYNIEKDIAAYIKKEFDKKYNPTWHCIVGRNFGSYVTHETKHFIYFYLGQVAILLFKSG